jgi:hypothetical protein
MVYYISILALADIALLEFRWAKPELHTPLRIMLEYDKHDHACNAVNLRIGKAGKG